MPFYAKRRLESRRYKWLPGTWFMRVARWFTALSVIKKQRSFWPLFWPFTRRNQQNHTNWQVRIITGFVWFGIFYHRKSSNELNWRNSSLVSSTNKKRRVSTRRFLLVSSLLRKLIRAAGLLYVKDTPPGRRVLSQYLPSRMINIAASLV